MTLPEWVIQGIEEVLSSATGSPVHLGDATSIGGGSINATARVDYQSGESFGRHSVFAKWSTHAPEGVFEAESEGLDVLGRAKSSLRVPEPIGLWRMGSSALLVMEYVGRGSVDPGYGGRLAEGLVALHSARPLPDTPLYGGSAPNFIGPLRQLNPSAGTWGRFWRHARVGPQLEQALRNDAVPRSTVWDRLLERLEEVADRLATAPSLLHGDLWSGNVFPDGDGTPTVVDPAPYRGDADVDLAMAKLFGGFPPDFDTRYREARFGAPDHDGSVSDARTALHQLYPLLVHANLFGSSYALQAERAAERVLAFAQRWDG